MRGGQPFCVGHGWAGAVPRPDTTLCSSCSLSKTQLWSIGGRRGCPDGISGSFSAVFQKAGRARETIYQFRDVRHFACHGNMCMRSPTMNNNKLLEPGRLESQHLRCWGGVVSAGIHPTRDLCVASLIVRDQDITQP
jgi:hypothetical protein